jgi:hypothetical protein
MKEPHLFVGHFLLLLEKVSQICPPKQNIALYVPRRRLQISRIELMTLLNGDQGIELLRQPFNRYTHTEVTTEGVRISDIHRHGGGVVPCAE